MAKLSEYTHAEREACVPIIDLMMECANVARREGVLALEEWVKDKDTFLYFMLMLVCDGTDPELVHDIGSALIEADGYTGAAGLARTIMKEGVHSVQAGENPRIIEMKLFAMLGEKFLVSRGLVGPWGATPSEADQKRTKEAAAQPGLPGSEAFHKVFASLTNRDIQIVLREVDQTEFAWALLATEGALVVNFLSNCSKNLSAMILEHMELSNWVPDEEKLAAQGRMLDIARRLHASGQLEGEIKE